VSYMKRENWDSRFLNVDLETERDKEMIRRAKAWGRRKMILI
jgi:hypothetical protein